MHFFFDRCLAVRLARMLDAYDRDHAIRHLDDDRRFGPTTPDVEWIQAVAGDEPKPALVTADVRIRRNPVERQALRDSGLTIFFFRAGFHELDMHQQAVKLLTIWPEIVKQTARATEPTAFEITAAARKVDRLCRTNQL